MDAIWIYFLVGCFALLLALISFLFAEIGDIFHDITSPMGDWIGDHVPGGHDHDAGFSRFINSGGILGFIAGFGFIAAVAMSQYNVGAAPAAGFGVLGGFVIGGFMGVLWFVLMRSEGTAGYKMEQLVGQKGVVTEKIFQGSLGRIMCNVNGMQVWHTAKALDGKEILPGATVKVVSVAGSILTVLPGDALSPESTEKSPVR